ncbi:MAG: tetratricopeptide repeat protein [Deltaproteobacteria bacterium]|nr:tetratricopeptide repeat protein [Deltaproteobacteria bacterium]MBW2725765.1 tetratricopeptide repeat protein [Deltaproteobacteria bacterium]
MIRITLRYTHNDAHGCAGILAALLLIFLVPIGAGCSSPENRAVYHLERGREFAAEGKDSAAQIEFLSALSFDSANLGANLELANLAEAEGNQHDARFYLQEALRVDSENNDVTVRLATLLRDDEPWRARQLLMTVVARDPQDATGHLGLSHIELSIGRPDEALVIVKRAIELDPSLPGSYWQLGIVYEALLEQTTAKRLPIDEAVRRAAVDAFEAFVSNGGEPEWKARLEQARILSTGSHNQRDALAAARRALDSARKAEGEQPKLIAAQHLANVARVQNNRLAYAESIEVRLEVTPRDFRTWRRLAEIREASHGSAETVYQDLFTLFPDDPEVHILYARHIGGTQGVWAAIRYFEEQIERGINGAQLLSALRSYQLIYHLEPQASRSLAKLVEQYPGDPWTQLELAKKSAKEGHSLAAIASLGALVQVIEIPEAFEVLAKLERFHHRPKRAIRAAQKAVDTTSYYETRLHRLLAETLFEGGRYREYLETLDVIERHEDLTPEQRLAQARALYVTDKGSEGREILLRLIEDPTTRVAATIEFASREAGDPKQRPIVRRLLRAAMTEHPDDRKLVMAMIDVNIRSGRPDVALRMLNELIVTEYPANVRYLRARLRAERGNLAGALLDLDLALRADPLLPGAIDFALMLYSKNGNTDRHLDKIVNWIRAKRARPLVDWLTSSRRISQLHLLHSRLLHLDGRPTEALAVLEAAISNFEYTVDTRIDLAYLLALTKSDVDRAIEIAQEIAGKQEPDPRALDTLGFAYLRDDNPIEALLNFNLANQITQTPNPLFRYHESVALQQLGREVEALEMIEGVLALDPSFPQAAEVRRDLKSSVAGEPRAS